MPKNINKNEIFDACIKGVETAHKNYEKWTGGWSARYAPESLTQVEVARELARIGCPAVSLEDMIVDIIRHAQGETKGKLPRNSLGRVDITVWHESSEPRFAIEIKKAGRSSALKDDVKRLGKLVDRCHKLQAGILVVLTSAVNAETVESRLDNMASDNKIELVKRSEIFKSKNKSEKSMHIGAAAYLVRSSHR